MGTDRACPGVGAHFRIGVEASLVPGVLQTLALLQIAHRDVEAAVDSALTRNPMLERAVGHPCPSCGRHIVSQRCRNCVSAGRSTREAEYSPWETLRVLAACEVHRRGRGALDAVLDHLTERGTLDADIEEIAVTHKCEPENLHEALRALKAVGPVGIAERSVPDLLATQAGELARRGIAPAWIVPLVRGYLELVAADDTVSAAALFDVSPADVAEVFSIVRRHLRPIAVFDTDQPNPHRPPDVYLRRDVHGALFVEAPDSRWFGLRVADVAPEIAADAQAAQWLRRHAEEARALLAQLDARADVLSQVVLAAARRQHKFLERGRSGHCDLTRSDVAHELGLHPSTVSRAVSGKVVRTPDGQFLALDELFGTGVAVRAELEWLLGQQARSDAQLATALAARGFRVARRTVAKYRAQLGVPAAQRS